MIVNAMVNEETLHYYRGYDIDHIVNIILNNLYWEQDLTAYAKARGNKQIRVNVMNRRYLELRELYGERSPKISLSRILEFARDTDFISSLDAMDIKVNKVTEEEDKRQHAIIYLSRAYANISDAIICQPEDKILPQLRETVGQIKRRLENAKADGTPDKKSKKT